MKTLRSFFVCNWIALFVGCFPWLLDKDSMINAFKSGRWAHR